MARNKKKQPHKDKTVSKLMGKAFESLSFTHQTLTVAESAVSAALKVPGSSAHHGKKAVKGVVADVARQYRGTKVKCCIKHKQETEFAVAASLKLLQRKYELTLEEAAEEMGIPLKDAKRILNKKAVKSILSSPAKIEKALKGELDSKGRVKKSSSSNGGKKKKTTRRKTSKRPALAAG